MRRQFTRPPSAETAKEFEGLSTLLEEHARTLSAFRQCDGEWEQLQLERRRAASEDGKARVQAYRRGKPDPGTKNEQKVAQKMEALRDKQAVLEGAYTQIEREISLLVSKERGAWLPKVVDLVNNDDEELAALLEQVGDVIKRRQNHVGLHEWLTELGPACTATPFVADGFNENVALNFLISTIGRTITNDDGEVEAIGA